MHLSFHRIPKDTLNYAISPLLSRIFVTTRYYGHKSTEPTDTTTNKTSDGSLIAKYLPHERHSGMMLDCIRSAAISKDCRHVLATTDANDSTSRAGILFRYEIIADQLEEYQPPQKKPASFSVDVCASAPTATALAVVQK